MIFLFITVFRYFFIYRLPFFPIIFIIIAPGEAFSFEIKPFKDNIFTYSNILKSKDNGDYSLVKYDREIDLYARDEIPARKVKQKYVKANLYRYTTYQNLEFSGRHIDIAYVAKDNTPEFAVLFIHGIGGNRLLGMKDYTFGGNFNRLKNLAIGNNGLYLTQTIRDFSKQGLEDTSALIQYLYEQKKIQHIILVCASTGGEICNRIAHNHKDVSKLSGIVLLGSMVDRNLVKSEATHSGLPIVIAHGNNDVIYSWTILRDIYNLIKLRYPGYPVRLTLFDTGHHGTPIRMIDWRQTLNWISKHSAH